MSDPLLLVSYQIQCLNHLPCKPVVAVLIPSFSCLSDEMWPRRHMTLNTAFLLTLTPLVSTTFAVRIKCHNKTLDRSKGRK